MTNKMKRAFSILLTLAMLVTSVPTSVFAEDLSTATEETAVSFDDSEITEVSDAAGEFAGEITMEDAAGDAAVTTVEEGAMTGVETPAEVADEADAFLFSDAGDAFTDEVLDNAGDDEEANDADEYTEVPECIKAEAGLDVFVGEETIIELTEYFKDASVYYLAGEETDTELEDSKYSCTPEAAGTIVLTFKAANNIGTCEDTAVITLTVKDKPEYITSIILGTEAAYADAEILAFDTEFAAETTAYSAEVNTNQAGDDLYIWTGLDLSTFEESAAKVEAVYTVGEEEKVVELGTEGTSKAGTLLEGVLQNGTSTLVIRLTDSYSEVTEYTITINKKPVLSALKVTADGKTMNLTPSFNAEEDTYEVMVPASASTIYVSLEAYITDTSSQILSVNGTTTSTGRKVAVAVPEEDTFSFTAAIKDTGNGTETSSVYTVTATKYYDVTFTVTPEDAIVTVAAEDGTEMTGTDGAYQLPAGTYTYKVEAEGCTSQEGTLEVNADSEKDMVIDLDDPRPSLTSLVVATASGMSTSTQLALSQTFDKNVLEYSVTRERNYTTAGTLYMKVTAENAAKIEVIYVQDGASEETVLSTTSGSKVTLTNVLQNGTNTVKIQVTNENGLMKEYKLHVNRKPVLKTLYVYSQGFAMQTLSPTFSYKTYEYNTTVSSTDTQLIIGPTLYVENSYQEIRVNGAVSDPDVEGGNVYVDIPDEDNFDITVTVLDKESDAVTKTNYVVHVSKSYPVSFSVDPVYAQVTVKDADGKEVSASKGIYNLAANQTYTYSVSATGYVTVEKEFSVNADSESTISVTLEKAEDFSSADHVMNLIDYIGGVSLNNSADKIAEARAAYDALSDEEKEKVTNFDTLTEAERYYKVLQEKAEISVDYEESTLNWSQFLGSSSLSGVSDAKTPTSSEELTQLWSKKATKGNTMFQHVSAPAYYNGYVYVTMDDKVYKLDAESGDELASNDCTGCMTLLPQVTCADGKVFCMGTNDASKTVVKVYRASDLEFLYQTVGLSGQQIETPIIYNEGYFYVASYYKTGAYYAFLATDEKLSYDISPEWELPMINADTVTGSASQGFLWAGAEFVGNYGYFGDHDGIFYAVNKKTGEVVDTMRFSGYIFESTPNYYEKNQRLYVSLASSSLGGAIFSIKLNSDGTFNEDSIKWFKSELTGAGMKSSVVIYNDRIYVNGGGGHGGSNEPFRVIDANTMTEIYRISDIGAKGTPVVSTAYATAENNYKVYIYVVPYRYNSSAKTSSMFIIEDCVGQTEPIYTEVTGIGQPQYCSQSMTIGDNGVIYYYNDANYLYAYGIEDLVSRAITGEDVKQSISNLPEITSYRYYNATEVKRIKERYDNLSEEEQAKVTNIQKLLDILELSGKDQAERLSSGIAAMPALEEITLSDRDMIDNLLSIYASLDDDQKANVEGYETLVAAMAAIEDMETAIVINAIIADIEKLPSDEEMMSTDQAAVYAVLSRVESLTDTSAVTNLDKLNAAKKRVDAVVAQRTALNKLITSTLDGVVITLENKDLIAAVDAAAEGLVMADVQSLESYQYFVSPAKVDLINALIKENSISSGMTVNSSNASALKAVIDEIQALYAGIIETDLKYLVNYDQVAPVQVKAECIVSGHAGASTVVKNKKTATYTASGYTGDTYCAVCGTKLETGSKIAAKAYTSTQTAAFKRALDNKIQAAWSGSKVKVTWGKVSAASGYDIYACYTGGTAKLVKTVKGNTTFSYNISKLNGSALNAKKTVKVYVKAFYYVDGKKTYMTTGSDVYAIGAKLTAYTNASKVKIEKSSYSVKVGKKVKVSATIVKATSGKKLLSTKYTKTLRYWSSNPAVAKVSSTGYVTGVKKGTCYIYVMAQNGVKARTKVTVK